MIAVPHGYMSQADYMSWRMEEDPILRSTIVAIAVVDRDPDWSRFVDMMQRGTQRVPLFRRKAVTDPLGPAPPRWVDDPDFELGWHLRRFRVPAGRSWDAVLDFARTAAMTAFDKERPLWEFTVLSGLDGGRAALVMKVHHSLTDGLGGMQIAREIVDFTREGAARDQPADVVENAADAENSPIGALGWYWDTAGSLTRGLPAALVRQGTQWVRRPVGRLRSSAALLDSTMRFTRPVLTTLSPVMTERSTRRQVAALDIPLDALGGTAAAAECSINDAFLASVLLGMAGYHRLHGVEISELRVTLPISLRTAHDPMGGNCITLARFGLPVDIAEPRELMRHVHRIVEAWRNEPAVALSFGIAGAFNLLPASILGNMFKHVDFVASNVVGSPVPMFIAGSEVLRYYAFAPTLGSAFNVTLMSYVSHCCVGLHVDADAVPDLDIFTEAIADGFRKVLGWYPDAEERVVRRLRDTSGEF
ncbi:WS/DGAT/MGAT family acyltransferase [Rhodococcus sp. SMB37]|uniref:wax ester/triacylglycerol synthase domain-containing protein n=1 Tax=Rhodococcus sp. SMB37 TaxID=2512213 RepID=UPI0010F2765B|nr:wax ester/triacylglycerol synthase domain-containing protein [Rhodococcus sp. SMB37]TCN54807.1 WS/DGAT/MGAT family acyltransferase [Rhodococcus sp. SMB37]